jgi:hypothetical protein
MSVPQIIIQQLGRDFMRAQNPKMLIGLENASILDKKRTSGGLKLMLKNNKQLIIELMPSDTYRVTLGKMQNHIDWVLLEQHDDIYCDMLSTLCWDMLSPAMVY